jgi:hypothetical protein
MRPRATTGFRRARVAAGAGIAVLLAAAVPLPAAGQTSPPPIPAASAAPAIPVAAGTPADCGGCGKVESIQRSTVKQQWTPLGTGVGVGGAPSLGDSPAGVTSYRIGPGLSNQGMVVLGAAGGAAYRQTPNSAERPRWDVTVKLDAGGVRIVSLSYEPFVREGDRVRVMGNNVELLDD